MRPSTKGLRKASQFVPAQLLSVQLLGLEQAARAIVTEMNDVLTSIGANYRFDLLQEPIPLLKDAIASNGHIDPEPAPKRRPGYIPRDKLASREDLISWTRKHDGVFDKVAWRKAHPRGDLSLLGNLVRYGILTPKDKDKKVYELNGEP